MIPATVAAIVWQRFETPGHDACRLLRDGHGWQLHGHAVFEHDERPCSLSYAVSCGEDWHTRSGSVTGFLGDADLDFRIERTDSGRWLLNGVEQPGVLDLIDLDLGFTPATNLLAIRRFNLAVGAGTEAPAAYLAFPELTLVPMDQTYRRLDDERYDYEGPMFSYHEVLEVDKTGFVTDYPRLFRGKVWRPGEAR